jgi:hypothetical protein
MALISPDPHALSTVAIGDSSDTVKTKLAITHDPVPAPFNADPYLRPHYDFSAQGVYIFFDREKRVRTLAFKMPFVGDVFGVTIGMTRLEVAKKLNISVADIDFDRNVFYLPDFFRIDFPEDSHQDFVTAMYR